MGYLGKARVKVVVKGGTPPNYNFGTGGGGGSGREGFDFHIGEDWNEVLNDREFPPRNIEVITDNQFAVMHPAKRYMSLNNRIAGIPSAGGAAAGTEINWTPLRLIRNTLFGGHDHLLRLIAPSNDMAEHPAGNTYDVKYKGPEWAVRPLPREPLPADDDIELWKLDDSGGTLKGKCTEDTTNSGGAGASTKPVDPPPAYSGVLKDNVAWIEQTRTEPGIWWGIQTDLNLAPNLPFYIDINRGESRVILKQPNAIIIRINATTGKSKATPEVPRFDIVLENLKRPRIYDWSVDSVNDPKTPSSSNITSPAARDMNLSIPDSGLIRIGFLPVCGRLAIYINNQLFLYSRNAPKANNQHLAIEPFVTKINSIQVFGTNSGALVCLGAMRFAYGLVALPFHGATGKDGAADQNWGDDQATLPSDAPGRKIYECPGAASGDTTAGQASHKVLGASFFQIDSSADASLGVAHVGYGAIKFYRGPSLGGSELGSSGTSDKQYYLRMLPQQMPFFSPSGDSKEAIPIGCPFVQRLRSVRNIPPVSNWQPTAPGSGEADLTADVVSLSENWILNDHVFATHTMEIALYNPNEVYTSPSAAWNLLNRCYTIQVYINWDLPGNIPTNPTGLANYQAATNLVFTGFTYGGFKSYTAGKETITITCEDSMAVLEHTRMLNSPYYDGMDVYDVVRDLAKRANIADTSILDDSDQYTRFYLPCGYSWTQPRMRFDAQSTLKDNIIEVCKIPPKVVYFDHQGKLHYTELQGGQTMTFFEGISPLASQKFRRDPGPDGNFSSPNTSHYNVILNEQKVDYKLASAVNTVFVRTVDRASGQQYMTSRRSLNAAENKFPYVKQLYFQSPLLASIDAANNYASMLQKHYTRTPHAISFQTIPNPNDDAANPLMPGRVIEVALNPSVPVERMRISNLSRRYSADDNSLETSITAEWWGSHSGAANDN